MHLQDERYSRIRVDVIDTDVDGTFFKEVPLVPSFPGSLAQ